MPISSRQWSHAAQAKVDGLVHAQSLPRGLMDALHAELLAVNSQQAAMRIDPLVTNAEPF